MRTASLAFRWRGAVPAIMAGTVVLAAAGAPSLAAGPAAPLDLDAPGAMAALERQDPARHARVEALVRVVARNEDCLGPDVAKLRVALDVTGLECRLTVMTSDPPKRRVAFTLDGTAYVKVVVLTSARGEFLPLRH